MELLQQKIPIHTAKQAVCAACYGSGEVEGESCYDCGGSGFLLMIEHGKIDAETRFRLVALLECGGLPN